MSADFEQNILDYYSRELKLQNTVAIFSAFLHASLEFCLESTGSYGLTTLFGKTWSGTHNWAYGTYVVSAK